MLFEEQLTPADTAAGFVDLNTLAARFAQTPDPMLAEMGGSRVDLAIGIGSTVYQLQVQPVDGQPMVSVNWVKAPTTARRLKDGDKSVAVGQVPVTLQSAVASLAKAFGISEQEVWQQGVDLLSFWADTGASDKLELPMSADWKRFALKKAAPAA